MLIHFIDSISSPKTLQLFLHINTHLPLLSFHLQKKMFYFEILSRHDRDTTE